MRPIYAPTIWLVGSLAYYFLAFTYTDSVPWGWETRVRAGGSALLFCLLPAYLWYCTIYQSILTRRALGELLPLFNTPQDWLDRIHAPARRGILYGALIGMLFGLSQTIVLINHFESDENQWLGVSLVVGNIILWIVVGGVIGRRSQLLSILFRAGYDVKVDIYNLQSLRPFANVVLADVLVIMGALALMPLQALDAQFRWFNYEAGIIIGVIATIAVVLIPMWGVHRSIQREKMVRLKETRDLLMDADRKDIPRLERILAHQDRIRSTNTWPLDMSLVSRVLFYLVIPPLAWIGAALVENLVEGFVG
jgi:hypothetical protein